MKNIILFGRAGSGKSTVAQMLYQGYLSDSNTFRHSCSVTGETRECSWFPSKDGEYMIYDTIGLGESERGSVPHEIAESKIYNFLNTIKNVRFDYVCIVKSAHRSDALDIPIFDAVKKMMTPHNSNHDIFKHMIIIITNSEDGQVKANSDGYRQYYNSPHIRVIGVQFPPVLLTDQDRERTNVTARNKSLNKLKTSLEILDYNDPLETRLEHLNETDMRDLSLSITKIILQVINIGLNIAGIACNMQ